MSYKINVLASFDAEISQVQIFIENLTVRIQELKRLRDDYSGVLTLDIDEIKQVSRKVNRKKVT